MSKHHIMTTANMIGRQDTDISVTSDYRTPNPNPHLEITKLNCSVKNDVLTEILYYHVTLR